MYFLVPKPKPRWSETLLGKMILVRGPSVTLNEDRFPKKWKVWLKKMHHFTWLKPKHISLNSNTAARQITWNYSSEKSNCLSNYLNHFNIYKAIITQKYLCVLESLFVGSNLEQSYKQRMMWAQELCVASALISIGKLEHILPRMCSRMGGA